ncbi:hypothetical protein Z950_1538 [Sulfitobacter mediterraneus KCTC 32188]|nr:hypothetical protein Z950_1538 [Sulfitobacter mediterraneus KCTC 32188]
MMAPFVSKVHLGGAASSRAGGYVTPGLPAAAKIDAIQPPCHTCL